MTGSKKLLVVIDPTTDHQMALTRAAQLASDINSGLHLFCCTYLDQRDLAQFSSRKDAKHHELERVNHWLESLAAPLLADGLNVECEAWWNEHWAESISHAAARCGASLIVKSSFSHNKARRTLSKTSDFTLLRHAPCPVLLTKSKDTWMNNRILAALAIDRHDKEHERLNNTIIREAQRLSQATGFDLHLVAAHFDHPDLAVTFEEMHLSSNSTATEKVAQRFGVPLANVHLANGTPHDVILDTAYLLKADLVIIGTTARQGLKGALMGNTAEKILDELETDLLTIG